MKPCDEKPGPGELDMVQGLRNSLDSYKDYVDRQTDAFNQAMKREAAMDAEDLRAGRSKGVE